ncbi:TAXI family TRAP transporter solute-binding subunit [Thalassobaculum sp. OXR-137]|uniref:TAXI family TRAP transporter solute-binding subunit n=1 Tax=Thalassobaculum sp. OXR-137 TaxID=3100173 RepID=UPI002AC96D4B|nr:TAXI family TRAP transporter solute-binding subunit [Thalassobaculum sp. OXR-137]WPZ35981.1 TAXI family TRAP transporter solute-binding subunit [Thalassobaculum sp. OXR-137]
MSILTRRTLLQGLGGAAGAAAMTPLLGGGAQAAGKIYQWGSSSLGSTGYQIITVLSAAASKFSDGRHASLSTAGGAENMALIGEGILDFGQSTTTDWYPAINGLGRYEGKPVNAVQMFSYTVWQCTPMVRADSGIETLEDLVGKRVMPAAAGGATTGLWDTLFEAAGIKDKVEWTYGSWGETYDALASGAVDCIPSLLTAGNPSGVMQRLETTHELKILPISQELVDKAAEMNPGVKSAMVSPDTWASLKEPTRMVSFGGVLAASPEISEEVGYNVTKAVYDNAEFVKQRGGVQLKDINPQFAVEFLMPAYPVNAGAAKYFKEQGVWNDKLKIHG